MIEFDSISQLDVKFGAIFNTVVLLPLECVT
jgi:hypothetical protein